MEKNKMTLIVNGETKNFEGLSTIADLIESLAIKGKRIAVAQNGHVVPKSDYKETVLKEQDAIEIVRMVGGG